MFPILTGHVKNYGKILIIFGFFWRIGLDSFYAGVTKNKGDGENVQTHSEYALMLDSP
jgi:hypothetical protein